MALLTDVVGFMVFWFLEIGPTRPSRSTGDGTGWRKCYTASSRLDSAALGRKGAIEEMAP